MAASPSPFELSYMYFRKLYVSTNNCIEMKSHMQNGMPMHSILDKLIFYSVTASKKAPEKCCSALRSNLSIAKPRPFDFKHYTPGTAYHDDLRAKSLKRIFTM